MPAVIASNRLRGARESSRHGLSRHARSTAALLPSAADALAQSALPIEAIRLPPGFAIEVLARVPNARAMTWGAAGTLFVGSARGEGLRGHAARRPAQAARRAST